MRGEIIPQIAHKGNLRQIPLSHELARYPSIIVRALSGQEIRCLGKNKEEYIMSHMRWHESGAIRYKKYDEQPEAIRYVRTHYMGTC
jgi:hypothetical protein